MTIVRTLPLLGVFVLFSCAAGKPVQDTPACPYERDTHERLSGLVWMQTSAEYQVLAETAYRGASARIATAVERHRAGGKLCPAALEQCGQEVLGKCDEGSPDPAVRAPAASGCTNHRRDLAVVVDIDETFLNNSPMSGELVRRRKGYDGEIWTSWVNEMEAGFIPGVEDFLRSLAGSEVKLVFVTNRKKEEKPATIENLRKLGLEVEEKDIYCSEDLGPDGKPWPSEKKYRRKHIAERYWIVALIGDDLADFLPDVRDKITPENRVKTMRRNLDAFGKYWFLLPNPLYGSWDDVVTKKAKEDDVQLRARRCRIESFATPETPPCEPEPASSDSKAASPP
jgi:5'-nucleotidase (lipoprotein e(P4) family)